MARPGDRRPFITDHAIAVLARGGSRGLSHQAVDRAVSLPKGSTSYYFRTREALISAVLDRVREHSRIAFESAPPIESLTAQSASAFIAEQLHALTNERRDQALAVLALLPEIPEESGERENLLNCLFSRPLAGELTRLLGAQPAAEIADDLINMLTGRLVNILFLPTTHNKGSQSATQRSVSRLLQSTIPRHN